MIRTVATLWLAGLRSGLQYRTDTFIVIAMAIVFQTTGFAFLWILLARFGTLAGWTLGELAFLYGLRLVSHAFAGAISGPMFSLEWTVRSGEFDRYLVRPVSPLVAFLTRRVEVSIFGDLIGGLAIFVVASQAVSIDWSPVALVYLALAIVGGMLVEVAWRVLVGALSFRLLSSQPLLFFVDSIFSTYGNYPLTIFGSALQFVFVFVLPLALVGYLPATVLLDRTGDLHVNAIFAWLAPFLGLVWIALATYVFRRELGQYQSAGHGIG